MHNLGWFLGMTLRGLWARRGRALLSLSALALSVGLVVATVRIGAQMQAGMATPAPVLGRRAAQVVWISSAYDVDYDLPADLGDRLGAVSGVGGVQPVLRRPARVELPPASPLAETRTETVSLLGVDPQAYFDVHGLRLAAGALPRPEEPGLVVLAPWALLQGLALGQPLTLTTPTGDLALPIAGLLEVDTLAAVQQGLALYAPLETVARAFDRPGAITTLEVRLAPGASPRRVRAALERTLGPAYAVSNVARPGQGAQLWQRLVLGALIFVDGLALAGSLVLAYAVFASAARSRRRQIGLLRAAGATGRQVLALLFFEAGLLGLGGSALGLILGLLFAGMGGRLVLGETGPPAASPWLAGLVAVALGLLGALAGALVPALRAARQTPLEALYARPPAAISRGGVGGAWLSRGRELPVEGYLAAANLARERGRAGLSVAALGLILAMALGNVGVLSLLGEELSSALGRMSGGDYLVLPGLAALSLRELAGQDTSSAPPLSPDLLAALEDLGDRVWLMGGTTAGVEALQVFPGQPTLLLDVEGYARMGGFYFETGDWHGALDAFGRGPAVLLAPVVARRLGVGLGDLVWLDTVRGPVAFTVAGIGDSEFTTCVLDLTQGAAHFGANEVNAVMVQVRPGKEGGGDAVRQALQDAVRTHGGTLLPLAQVPVQLAATLRQARLSMGLLIAVAGMVAVLGMINAVLSSMAERGREIGLLRAVGATRRQVARLILAEMALLGGAAALLGTALGWGITFLFLVVGRAALGLPGEGAVSLPAWLPLVAASLAGLVLWPLLAMLGGLGPALHAVRQPIIPSLPHSA